MISKLRSFGIANTELRWFENYLSNRTQIVTYGNQTSQPRIMETGVPQGSILGPLLFVLFINDLPQTVTNCTTLMYADDTVLYYSAKTVSEIEHTINSEFESISTWIRNNSLFLHHG